MKAWRVESFGSLDRLRLGDEQQPRPQRGELLVRVHAVALNYRDLAIALDRYPHVTRPGLIPTSDASGEVVEIGEDVDAFRVGDRVMSIFHPRWFGGRMPSTIASDGYGAARDGWLTTLKAVSQEAVLPIPRGLSFAEAATLPCAGLTAWTALGGTHPVRAGATVLTMGSGGVSIFAIQLAKLLGARVIATTSNGAKAERLRALGADAVVDYVREPRWGAAVRALADGRGVDRIVEVGGPGTIGQSIEAVAYGGEIASIGFLSRDDPGIDFFALKRSGATIRNIMVGDRDGLIELSRTIAVAGLQPVIDRQFAFEEAPAALAHLQSARHLGKVVINGVRSVPAGEQES